ncbi:uncharacterized protein TA07190 [Theileria annulata]|uniref:Methyltransferase domain-containing protein n=1 Tax=Theileria annulata TaxID=5874 RepID=Q4UAA4_THEAN|nr:uncharacterized protein TA07190 [Theileria annulata]CAI76249.1 hypothetical protein, conserved [Theileria annulata]|eukprot:XP_952873.1 hypothetical protein, conserved [Theileria annulata]
MESGKKTFPGIFTKKTFYIYTKAKQKYEHGMFNIFKLFIQYFDSNYWNAYYDGDDEHIEWYDSWVDISKNIPLEIKVDSRVLHIGCGSSSLGIDLFNSGVESVINADFSEVCINLMKKKYPHLTCKLLKSYSCLDILLDALDIDTKFSENFFDFIIDKGCLDSILCHENYQEKVQKLLENFYTCLKVEGYLIVISGGNPEERLIYFNNDVWKVEVVKMRKQGVDLLANFEDEEVVEEIPEINYFYTYICLKRSLDSI